MNDKIKPVSGSVTNRSSRRTALKIASGAALTATIATQSPKRWTKPVVNSVILPSHAVTSATDVVTTTPAPQPGPGGGVGNAGNAGNASDIRLKTDIEVVGQTAAGLKLYKFQYLNDPDRSNYVGLMAQDLLGSHPQTLLVNDNGYYHVRYDLLGLRMTTLEEWDREGLASVQMLH